MATKRSERKKEEEEEHSRPRARTLVKQTDLLQLFYGATHMKPPHAHSKDLSFLLSPVKSITVFICIKSAFVIGYGKGFKRDRLELSKRLGVEWDKHEMGMVSTKSTRLCTFTFSCECTVIV